MCVADSEDEFEESYAEGYSHEPILEPKDSYGVRPLPLQIGTPAFLAEDDVGLGDYASGSEGEGGGGGGREDERERAEGRWEEDSVDRSVSLVTMVFTFDLYR